MNRKNLLLSLLSLALLSSCSEKRGPADFVQVFNGTDLAGNTYPGATVPFGAVQLSPDTEGESASGYRYAHTQILGFSHTHLSGTGLFLTRTKRPLRATTKSFSRSRACRRNSPPGTIPACTAIPSRDRENVLYG